MEEVLFQNYTRLLDATDSKHYRYLIQRDRLG